MKRFCILLICFLIPLQSKARELGYKPLHEESVVVKLTDASFEHETQASTGQTTGSWLVWFHTEADETSFDGDLPDSSFWEENHVVLASVNSVQGGKSTFERFQSNQIPFFLFIHKGKMYRYERPTTGYNWESIVKFVQFPQEYAKAEDVPPPRNMLNVFLERLQADSSIKLTCGAIVAFLVLLLPAKSLMSKKEKSA